ncbi:LuxR C-terminal-related transcriptional regulator [Flammeovirga agarivorans]|nr:LuxR C-terminal-related transcriptional regulator [Flammeovirga agarivorans]
MDLITFVLLSVEIAQFKDECLYLLYITSMTSINDLEEGLRGKYLSLGDNFSYIFNCFDRKFENVSENFTSVTGYAKDEILNADGFTIGTKEFQSTSLPRIKQILETFYDIYKDNLNGFRSFFSYPFVYKDGRVEEVFAEVTQVDFEDKQIVRITVFNTLFDDTLDSALKKGVTFVNLEKNIAFSNISSVEDLETCHAILSLSKREIEILSLVSEGLSNQELAEKINVSIHTVTTHKKNIVKKTNTKNIMVTIRYCLRLNIF